MGEPDDVGGGEVKYPVYRFAQQPAERGAGVEDQLHPLALELDMISFVDQDVAADLFEEDAGGSVLQRLVKYLRAAFYGKHCERPDLHAGVEITDLAEKRVAPVMPDARFADAVEVAAEIFAVFLFFFDKQPNGFREMKVARFSRMEEGGVQQGAVVGGFAELPGLEMPQDSKGLGWCDGRGEVPVDAVLRSVVAEKNGPSLARNA